MALDAKDREDIAKLIEDGIAGAGEQFATQAKTAATEAIDGKVIDFQKAVKDLGDQVAAIPKTAGDPAAIADAAKAVVTAEFKARDEAAAAGKAKTDADGKVTAAREKFLADKAAKLPAAYHAEIPAGDEAAMKAGLEKAQAAFKADAASGKYGIKLADVGAAGPNKAGADGTDVDKLTPVQGLAAAYKAEQNK